MRKLILKMSVSIDGFVGGPNGEIDWIFKSRSKDGTDWTIDTLWQAGVHIMGSRTYQVMAAYWPTSTDPFAAPMNEIPKVVFSRKGFIEAPDGKLTTTAFKDAPRTHSGSILKSEGVKSELEAKWAHSKVVSGDLIEEINNLKKQTGKDILAHGGASFAQSLAKYNLIDEYRLIVHPVALGSGLPLFSALSKPIDLKLISSVKFSAGTIANTYRLN
jgi:dihydrofolate reductase